MREEREMVRSLKPWILHHLPTIFAGPQGSKQMGPSRNINTLFLAEVLALNFYVACYWENGSHCALSMRYLLPTHTRLWRAELLTVSPPLSRTRLKWLSSSSSNLFLKLHSQGLISQQLGGHFLPRDWHHYFHIARLKGKFPEVGFLQSKNIFSNFNPFCKYSNL